MSEYKLTAIYKQKLRCKLPNFNKYRRNSCFCCHCWIDHRLQPCLKVQVQMNTKMIRNDNELNRKIDEQSINILKVPLPPPLPLPTVNDPTKLVSVYKSKTVSEEARILWKNREVVTYGDDIPTEFALIKLEPILQEGPNCGLAALAMAATATPRRLAMDELFFEAKNLGYTKQGEMFSATNMAQLAKSVLNPWFTVEMLVGGLSINEEYILRSLFEGALMLVPYDAAGNYSPCCKKGHKSHWAVICGVARIKRGDPNVHLYARQGKSKYMNLWPYEQLEASNNNLVEFSPKRAEDGSEYMLPDGGVEAGLSGKVIILHRLHKGPDFTSIDDL